MITAALNKRVEAIAKHIGMDDDTFVKQAAVSYLAQKKRSYLSERFEILSRYSAVSAQNLKSKIESGSVPGHPTLEDLIEIENIEAEIGEIDNDIQTLQAASGPDPEIV